jgi:hypothetical protein
MGHSFVDLGWDRQSELFSLTSNIHAVAGNRNKEGLHL